MTDLTDLLRSLDADAERELAGLLAEQQRQADALLEAARHEAARTAADAVGTARDHAEQQATQLLTDAATAARRAAEDALESALAEVTDTVRTQLHVLAGDPGGAPATLRLLAEAQQLLPTATAARVCAAHQPAAQQAAPHLRVTGDLDDVGVVLTDEGGRCLDNTATTRLRSAWPHLRTRLVASWRSP